MKDGCNIVLLFHSIDDRSLLSFKDLGNINPAIFEGMLRSLKKDFDIISLADLVGCILRRQKRKGRLLAITFDDGPKSYAVQAVPLMESLGIPSTCFLITDCIGDRAIYWRYLYNFCMHSGRANELAVMVSAEYGTAVSPENLISFTRRNFTKQKNQRIMERIFQTMMSEQEYRDKERDLFLSDKDIDKLKGGRLAEFGIHTRTHPVMRHLDDAEIEDEIRGSVDFYRRTIRDHTPMLSIPFGRLYKDYDERVIAVARKFSLEVVLSAYGGDNAFGQPLYNVRRISVNEDMLKDGPENFMRHLERLSSVPEYSEAEKRLYDLVDR